MPCSVAVIVPVYNRPRLVLDALASVAAQTRRPEVLIVVDDGSTDETAERVAEWMAGAGTKLTARLIRQANAKVAAARNRGVVEAGNCDLLAFLDSDDIWPPDYLQRMTATMAETPAAVAASCDLRRVDLAPASELLLSARRLDGPATVPLFDRYCPTPSSTVLRTAHFQAVGGFNPLYEGIEDQDLFLRISLRGPWKYVPDLVVTYRRKTHLAEPGSFHLNDRMETTEQTFAHIQMLKRFLVNHGGNRAVPAYRRRHYLARCWHRLGKLYLRHGRPAEAIASFKEALCECPLYHRSLTRLLRTLVTR